MKYSIITKKYNFRLEEPEVYPVALPDTDYHPYFRIKDGKLRIEPAFLWDGSSIPGKGLLKMITRGLYDGDRYCKDASLVHDPSCQMLRLGLLPMKHKDTIDRLYEKMCIEGATKIIRAIYSVDYEKINESDLSYRKKRKAWNGLWKKRDRQLKRLPAWAARRYWAVKRFGARTLNKRYYPEKVILST